MDQNGTKDLMEKRRKTRQEICAEAADLMVSTRRAQIRRAPRLAPHHAQHLAPTSSSSQTPSRSASGRRPGQNEGAAAMHPPLHPSTAPAVQSSRSSFCTPPRTPREPRPRNPSHPRLSNPARQDEGSLKSVVSFRAKQHGSPLVPTPPPSHQRVPTPSRPVGYRPEASTTVSNGSYWGGHLTDHPLTPQNEPPQLDSPIAGQPEAFVKMEEAQRLEAEDRLREQEDIRKLLKMPEIEIPPEKRANTPIQMSCQLMEHQKVALKWLKDQEKIRHKRGGLLAGTSGKTRMPNSPRRAQRSFLEFLIPSTLSPLASISTHSVPALGPLICSCLINANRAASITL